LLDARRERVREPGHDRARVAVLDARDQLARDTVVREQRDPLVDERGRRREPRGRRRARARVAASTTASTTAATTTRRP
jgi:hypothetical protein